MTICKFVPQICKAILKEFQQEYLVCPTDSEDWKKIEERFRHRWNVPHAVGALDGKHIGIKKPRKSGSEYFNYKSYFSLVLLALVDADYKWDPVALMLRYSTWGARSALLPAGG